MTPAPARTLRTEAAPEDVGLSSLGLDRVEAIITDHIDRGIITGAVTLTARHGVIVRQENHGRDRWPRRRPLARDTIFHIFSMTKPITGLAMGILADRGLWHPDDPIAKHLPELADRQVMTGVDASGRPVLVEADHQPTMRELMTHMAGYTYGRRPGDPLDALFKKVKPLRAKGLDDFVDRISRLPLANQPGTEWRYSIAMDIQGAIIERLTGRRLADFMRDEVFEPLGMVDTGFYVPREKKHRLAGLYFNGRGIRRAPVPNPMFRDPRGEPTSAWGGMGLFSTVDDYARFAQLLLNEGRWGDRRIVSAEAVRAQMTNHVPVPLLEGRFETGHMHFRPGFGYGYNGVVVYDPIAAELPVGRGTYFWDGAAGTWFWADPENDLLYVGMIQLLSYSAPPLQRLTQVAMAGAITDKEG